MTRKVKNTRSFFFFSEKLLLSKTGLLFLSMELNCTGLIFSYTNAPLIRNISLQLKAGQPVWVRGRSGSGKSTFLKLMTGLLTPHEGRVDYLAANLKQSLHELSSEDLKSFRAQHVGYVHQENHLINHWTVSQNLSLVEGEIQKQSLLLESLGFEPGVLKKTVSELSGGERQRISVARLILQNPSFAFLDEPTSHLDDENAEKVMRILKKTFQDKVLLVVSHDQRLSAFGFKEVDFSELNK